MKILVTNDDGIDALGLRRLEEALRREFDVLVCAPDREQSAASHSLSLSRPLRLMNRGEGRWACDGTPTDCVLIAKYELYKGANPDLIISGINHGQNMGEDVTYSGTIAAAIEGSILGIPSIAASLIEGDDRTHTEETFAAAAQFLARFVKAHREFEIPPTTFLNINFPDLAGAEYSQYQFTRLGLRVFNDVVIQRTDPRGGRYYWIAGEPDWTEIEGSDYSTTQKGVISVTPLRVNFDDGETLGRLGESVCSL
ncbi:MAG TPA: 5'/3'-nucleotidase SurE [candidate division Zixibacteria bacterium]|nr:5'/3'-nucleotidase SurE [candidate division Zixibacteria bacterium]